MPDSKPTKAVKAWMKKLEKSLAEKDTDKAVKLFGKDSYWRDLVSLTWNIKTVEGRDAIADMLNKTLASEQLPDRREEGGVSPPGSVRNRGWTRLRSGPPEDGKIWTLLTTLAGTERPRGAQGRPAAGRQAWRRQASHRPGSRGARSRGEGARLHRAALCLIIGGGQGGIALGARLRQLGVPTIIIEKNDRPGDSWRNRYKSLCLHDPVWYDHLPYIKFPDHWPVFSPKDKIGDWLEMLHQGHGAELLDATTAKSAAMTRPRRMDRRRRPRRQEVVLKPKQLVLATGMSGKAEHARLPRHGPLQGRPAPFLQAPRPRRLPARRPW
jgi:putative flavoprotein involved in K+ transport